MSAFPSPCLKCNHEGQCNYKKCGDYRMWINYWWKKFNAYAKHHNIQPTTPPEPEETTEKGNETDEIL